MKTQATVRCYLLSCLIFVLAALTPAYATLTMTLNGTPGSPLITVSFSGSATVGHSSGNIINFGWDFAPTNFNPFPPQITGADFGQFTFVSGSPQFLDLTTHQSSSITGVWLQDSSNAPVPGRERFGMLDSTPISYTLGHIYQWSGSAIIDLSSKGLTFDSLQPGSTGPIYPLDGPAAGVLDGQLVIVPEPSTTILLTSAAFAGILFLTLKRPRPSQIGQ